jgi:predicted permease
MRELVSSGYFDTLRIPILRGRALGEADAQGSAPTVVVNAALAHRYFADQEPLGKRIKLGSGETPWRTIVGVAADVLNAEPPQPQKPQAYVPFAQQPVRALTIFMRTANLEPAVAAARREVARLDPEQPLYDVRTIERVFFEELASHRVVTGMFAVFAAVALGLAAVGLYGLISYTVSQRRREIGLRAALGARRGDILRLVLGQGLRLIALGLGAGLVLGLGLGRAMAGALAGVSPTDTLTFTLVPLTLGAVALLATAIPARRAARYDPALVLRAE